MSPSPPPEDRVLFGPGTAKDAARHLLELGARRVLVIARAHHRAGADTLARDLGEACVGVFATDQPQVPGDVADAAVARARDTGADWVVARGGGTPIGVAKAVALELDVQVGAIPTTYAGSERTDIWGLTREGRKTTGRDDRVRPRFVVYDPLLTLGLSREHSLTSLFNALAHSIEALYAEEATAAAREAARQSLEPLLVGIRSIGADPDDLDGRTVALRGARLASEALGGASMALHHKLAHVLGGTFGTPHAATHATLLPYVLGFNAPAVPEVVGLLRRAWNTDDPPALVYDLQRALGLGTSLRRLGLHEDDLAPLVEGVLAKQYANPRPLVRDDLLALASDLLHDRRPSLRTRRAPLPSDPGPAHAGLEVSWRGAPLERAKVAVLGIHGRGASADRFLADLEDMLGPAVDVALVAPQARQNAWYPHGFLRPVEENQPHLDSALAVVQSCYETLADALGAERVVVAGFSQGACLLATWLSCTTSSPREALLFTGAATPLPGATWQGARRATVHLGAALADRWVQLDAIRQTVAALRQVGATVDLRLADTDTHTLRPEDGQALRDAVGRARHGGLAYQAGFSGPFQTEALPGALPLAQNSPREVGYGLVAEQINGTGFTVGRALNRRTWMYRLRPQLVPRHFRPRDPGRFRGTFDEGVPLPEILRFHPQEIPSGPVDFLSGITTYAGAGDPTTRRGAAIHLVAASVDMDRTAFCNIDGDLVLVPQQGRFRVRTELGILEAAPGQLLVLPRGIRFAVSLPDGPARGFLAEVFDGHLQLPERGPVGANGLADERHFRAPVAAFEDDARAWTVVVRQGGRLWEVDAPHSPFDVVAWHGTYTPLLYDLDHFNSLGSVSFDHPDPSILTVLTVPMDEHGRNALDVAVFAGRWDASEHTFRPPYFHRNSAVEFNGVLRSPAGSRWAPGTFTWTPYLTPHGVSARGYQGGLEGDDAPHRIPDESLWVQFESTYPLKVMPWMLDHPTRDSEYLEDFDGYRPASLPPSRR